MRLLSRNYCHLCQDMLSALNDLCAEPQLAQCVVTVVDVDKYPALEERYGERVPVLLDADGQELCHYFLDIGKVREYLSTFR